MAERAGQQLCAADFKRFTVSVLCADGDVHRALDHAKLTREREAALCAVLLAGGFDDFRVDKLNAALADIDNDDTAQQTDLRCSKADAVCVLHRLVHIVKQRTKLLVEFFDRAAHFGQHVVALFHNISKRHLRHSFPVNSNFCYKIASGFGSAYAVTLKKRLSLEKTPKRDAMASRNALEFLYFMIILYRYLPPIRDTDAAEARNKRSGKLG